MAEPGAAETDRRHRAAAIRRVLLWTLAANLAVVVAKAVAGLRTDTLSVLADSAHSAVDASNNLLGLFLAGVAAKAPDALHPYGHAKFETLGAMAVVAFLSITVFELVSHAVRRLLGTGAQPEATPLVVGVMIGAALISGFVSVYEQRMGRKLGSPLLTADSAHTRSDVYATGAVLVGLGFIAAGYPQADALATLLVAAVIARAGWRILRSTVPELVDERVVEAARIRSIATSTPDVTRGYDVRSRGRSGEAFVELTISVAPGLNVEQAHQIADEVERRVARQIGAREVVVHVEPAREDASAEGRSGRAAAAERAGPGSRSERTEPT